MTNKNIHQKVEEMLARYLAKEVDGNTLAESIRINLSAIEGISKKMKGAP